MSKINDLHEKLNGIRVSASYAHELVAELKAEYADREAASRRLCEFAFNDALGIAMDSDAELAAAYLEFSKAWGWPVAEKGRQGAEDRARLDRAEEHC